ncbi:MAG: ABZJ_00895 family protein, partial [Pseudomonadota bacterium]
ILTTLALTVIAVVMRTVFQIDPPSGAMTIIPAMAAALHAGQTWGKERGTIPESREAWRFAFVGGLIFLALQLFLLPMALATLGSELTSAMRFLVPVLVLVTVVTILLNRFFLVMGAKGTAGRS